MLPTSDGEAHRTMQGGAGRAPRRKLRSSRARGYCREATQTRGNGPRPSGGSPSGSDSCRTGSVQWIFDLRRKQRQTQHATVRNCLSISESRSRLEASGSDRTSRFRLGRVQQTAAVHGGFTDDAIFFSFSNNDNNIGDDQRL